MQIVEPQQEGTALADLLEHAHQRPAADLGRVEEKALARRSKRQHLTGRRWAKPLGGGRDERVAVLIVLVDLPDIEKRLFDEAPVGTFEPKMGVDGADD